MLKGGIVGFVCCIDFLWNLSVKLFVGVKYILWFCWVGIIVVV